MNKKRAMITVNAEQWDMLQKELKDRGYPANSMSVYISACLNRLEENLGLAEESSFDPFFEIEVSRIGLKAALIERGFQYKEGDPEDS